MSKHPRIIPGRMLVGVDPLLIIEAEGANPRPPRILVALKASHDIRPVRRCLRSVGCQVITASDGREALTKVKSEVPDLVMLDTMLPFVDGFEVVKAMRADPHMAGILSILLKTNEENEFEDFCRKCFVGAECMLSAPFHPLGLVLLVRRFFEYIAPRPREEHAQEAPATEAAPPPLSS